MLVAVFSHKQLLETLQTPVDQEAFELQCINEGPSVRLVYKICNEV